LKGAFRNEFYEVELVLPVVLELGTSAYLCFLGGYFDDLQAISWYYQRTRNERRVVLGLSVEISTLASKQVCFLLRGGCNCTKEGICFLMLLQFPKSKEHRKGIRLVRKLNHDSYQSSQDVSRWLGVSVRTIVGWAKQWLETGGKEGIPALKVGRSWRFDAEQLEHWLDDKQRPNSVVPEIAAAEQKIRSIG
jgi:excisionase family DNA binding protein